MHTSMKITYLGDSVTCGQHVDPTLRWTALIDQRLGPGWTSRNEGVNGETTRQALERFPQAVQADPPDILTIQYGLNDCNCWQTDRGVPRVACEAFMANLEEMATRAHAFKVRRVIMVNGHPSLRSSEYEEASERYAARMRAVTREPVWPPLVLCDTRRAFRGRDLSALLLPDGLHLSPVGHALYADTIWPVLECCIRELDHD